MASAPLITGAVGKPPALNAPRVIPQAAISPAFASCAGIARSFTQYQYGIVTNELTAVSAASIFARYSLCQVRKFRLPCAPHIIPAIVSIA